MEKALLDLRDVADTLSPLPKRTVQHLAKTDPRFPQPLYGGQPRTKAIWAAVEIQEYLKRLATEGLPR